MPTNFNNTLKALQVFQDGLACANCEKSKKELQYLGSSCKHAFCWDCITEMNAMHKKKRGYLPLCPRCAMKIEMHKITGALILNNCYEMVEELVGLIKEFDTCQMTTNDIECTQKVFNNFDAGNENARTVDDFLLTQPAFIDNLSDEILFDREDSCSPEIDLFGELKNTPVECNNRKSQKRHSPIFKDEGFAEKLRKPSKVPKIETSIQMELFESQVPTRAHDNNTLTPFVNRKERELSKNIAGPISMFADPIRSNSNTSKNSDDDPFTKQLFHAKRFMSSEMSTDAPPVLRRASSTNVSEIWSLKTDSENQREPNCKRSSSSFASISSRASSPAVTRSQRSNSPRRSSLGTRRGEVVIVNSIKNNRIPQLIAAIEAGTSVNEKEGEKTPLYMAVECNNLEAAKLLVDAGAIINASCLSSCETTLHEAVRQNNYQMIEFLLSKGASMKIKNSWQKTAEDLVDEQETEILNMFKRYKNKHILQPVIPPRRPVISFVQLANESMLTEAEKSKLPGKINIVSIDMSGATHAVVETNKQNVLTINKDNISFILSAIIKCAKLVNIKWLKSCIRNHEISDDDKPFLVNKIRLLDGDVVEGSIDKWRRNEDRMGPKLFVGCKFFFLRTKYELLDRPTLVELVRAGGGLAFSREPVVSKEDPPPYYNPDLASNIIVYSLNHNVPEKYRNTSKYTLVGELWLIEAILNFSINSQPY